MKRPSLVFALFLACTLAATFAASVRYDAKVWSAVKTYDLVALTQNLDAHMRELVGVKCSGRGKEINHTKSNWYQSSIWQPVTGQSGQLAHVPVMVAKPDLKAFKSIPTDSSGAEITLYGRVEYDVGSKFKFLRLVGRNATLDPSGRATVTW